MFQASTIKSSFFFSFLKTSRFFLASIKKPNRPVEGLIKPIWHNIYKRLQNYADEQAKIEKNLIENSENLDSRSKDSLRVRLNELEPVVSLHAKYRNIFKGFDELKEMEIASPDEETKQFIKEESENYKNLLAELEEKAIEFLIPKDRFEDCMSINFEIRPGFANFMKKLIKIEIIRSWRHRISPFC